MRPRKILRISVQVYAWLALSVALAGGPFDHAVNSFQALNKPTPNITWADHGVAIIKHVETDAAVAENGTNLIYTQGFLTWMALQKAKQVGRAAQWRLAYFEGNLIDLVDKGLTGGAIRYQLEQIPVVGELASYMVPSLLNHELIHSIPGYPHPGYSMTEGQYFWFQVAEFGLLWFQLDGIKVHGNRAFVEVPL